MANEQHLAKLKEGVEAWNKWREEHPQIIPDIYGVNFPGVNLCDVNMRSAYLVGTNLIGANLKGANLISANLWGANLMSANLSGANLEGADLNDANLKGTKLEGANLSSAKLTGVKFSSANLMSADLSGANLSGAKLEGANLMSADLSGANLSGSKLEGANLKSANLKSANLKNTDFSEADFFGVNLSGVNFSDCKLSRINLENTNLSNANLTRAEALETNFANATLTGTCIQDWNINSKTNFENVKCDYIYLKQDKQDRRPHNPNKIFAPREFTKLFQQALETVDLIFSNGIEWTAFLESFQQLQAKINSEELSIQAIEKKLGGSLIVRLEVPSEANKAEIEKYLQQQYQLKLEVIEEKYRSQLNAQEKELTLYRQQNTDFIEIMKSLANRPIHVENKNIISDRNTTIENGNYNENIVGNYHQSNLKSEK